MLRTRLKDPAALRCRFGDLRLHLLLEREGFRANHKKLFRIYKDDQLAVRTRVLGMWVAIGDSSVLLVSLREPNPAVTTWKRLAVVTDPAFTEVFGFGANTAPTRAADAFARSKLERLLRKVSSHLPSSLRITNGYKNFVRKAKQNTKGTVVIVDQHLRTLCQIPLEAMGARAHAR